MTEPLATEDRCDRCGARAAVRVDLDAGTLAFCAHHARQYGFVDELERVSG